jgi:6,7-dimethyl-8-ribityllumazine synthase
MREIRGDGGVVGTRFAVVAARFNSVVVERLVQGAGSYFDGVGVDEVDLVWVPGAFELPLVARRLAASRQYDAVVCLGAVVRGETPHFEHVAGQAAEGISRAALETGIPVIFGVLTADTIEQALDRAGGSHGNKGWDAARAAVEMASLMGVLPKEERP